ncbi:MAG: thymidine phosphorylase [Ignavibacteria bacterium]|nr:thymidine phosphorylase [Ignavibacteria bacterium]
MNVVDIIRKKKTGIELSKEEILFMVNSFTKGKVPTYQFSAFLMAVYFKGMTTEETAALTEAMLYSGKVIDLSVVPGFKVDKHSTGGVGDKTSLILAPIVAAAGISVPMISGRGLGHTGGTLDKLEAIPGFKTNLSLKQYKKALAKVGAVMIGQTKEIAPADKEIYALRDVTSTVESIALITSSIMSKKLAEGIDGLVLDIKTGSGAFMQKLEDSRALANSLINTAKQFDKKVVGFITDMNQPLGNYIGNWLEVVESVEVLQGKDVPDLNEVTFNLSGAMLVMGGVVKTIEEGIEKSKELIASGKAFDKFVEMAKFQGGDVRFLKDLSLYPKPKFHEEVFADADGYLAAVNNLEVGMAALELGAGRMKLDDAIDPKAGIIFYPKIGDKLTAGTKIADVYCDNKKKLEAGKERLVRALQFSEKRVSRPKLIREIIQ